MAENKIRRFALRGATVLVGGLAIAGTGAGMASAATQTTHGGPDWGGNPDVHGPTSSLVDLSHNQVPIQGCHNQVPVNVLGGQVPVHDVTGAVGAGLLGSSGSAPAAADNHCTQPAGQAN